MHVHKHISFIASREVANDSAASYLLETENLISCNVLPTYQSLIAARHPIMQSLLRHSMHEHAQKS